MVTSEDKSSIFLPSAKPAMIILGTMVAISARTLDGVEPEEETFFYHNPRNHFWRVLQRLVSPNHEPLRFSIKEKKRFLRQQNIGICNIVTKIEVPNREAHDPSDTVLFAAHKKGRVGFRKLSHREKRALESSPLYFTCRSKKGIQDLLTGFCHSNRMKDLTPNICFLPTPTRCNPKARAEMWREEMDEYLLQKP